MAGTRDAIQLPADGAGKKTDAYSFDLSDGRGTAYAGTAVLCNKDGAIIGTIPDGTAGQAALEVAQSATNFIASPTSGGNSSTSQLNAAATFTGTWESVWSQQAISVLITSDQTLTLHLQQAIDSGGTRIISDWTFTVAAGVPFSRAFTANGNYFRLTALNTSGSTATTTLNINTAYGTMPPVTGLGNGPVAVNEIGGAAPATSPAGTLPVAGQGMAATGGTLAGYPVRIGGSDGTYAQDVNVTAKAVQGARGLAVQDLKDSGRTSVMVTANVASTATTETLISVNKSLGLAGTGAASSNAITSGKRFRIQAIIASVRNSTGTVASNVTLAIRAAVGGATTASSPLQFQSMVPLPASSVAVLFPTALIADGFEIDSNGGTNTWGVTITHPQWSSGTQVATFTVCIVGYEY